MIQIYKNYEGKKELEELDHIELESWVMVTDPTMEELTNISVSYTHLRAHETDSYLVCRLLLEKKKKK